jgi:hypothetical protein
MAAGIVSLIELKRKSQIQGKGREGKRKSRMSQILICAEGISIMRN